MAAATTSSKTTRGLDVAFILKKAVISAAVALVLFSLMIGVRTEAGSDGQLTYWTRFGDLAGMVATVFGGSGTAVVNFNHTGNYNFTPQLTGSLAVNKLSTGTTTLTTANTYTGRTTVDGGEVLT